MTRKIAKLVLKLCGVVIICVLVFGKPVDFFLGMALLLVALLLIVIGT